VFPGLSIGLGLIVFGLFFSLIMLLIGGAGALGNNDNVGITGVKGVILGLMLVIIGFLIALVSLFVSF